MNNVLKYKKVISKEELNLLELNKYSGEIYLVETNDAFKKAVLEIGKSTLIGIDTETKPSFKKGVINSVALLQIATEKKVYIFRLNKVQMNSELASILANKNITKVGIAIHDDLKDLKKIHHFNEENVVDLNILAPKLGFESIGAKKLTALVLGFRISKRQQVSNWEAVELSKAQIDYAATDAWICREIYLRLKE